MDNTRPAQAEKTHGQRAYETYAALLQTQWPMAVWQGLSRLERYAWEAAAEAVLAHAGAPPRALPLEEDTHA